MGVAQASLRRRERGQERDLLGARKCRRGTPEREGLDERKEGLDEAGVGPQDAVYLAQIGTILWAFCPDLTYDNRTI